MIFNKQLALCLLSFFLIVGCSNHVVNNGESSELTDSSLQVIEEPVFHSPDTSGIGTDKDAEMIRYGRALVMNTAYYLGPDGIVSKNLGNKMNCTNCHQDGGTKPFALNYFSSHANYPQYRARENKILTLASRVNNCIERPHNGKPLPLDSKEMVAILCYMKWLGKGVPVGEHVNGDAPGLECKILDRKADIVKGEAIYKKECQTCHGVNGEGKMRFDNVCYEYPPLWGPKSYQKGSSMHRVMKMAKFVKANMPHLKATWEKPYLTDEEAIDVAAFVNADAIHGRPESITKINYEDYYYKALDYDKGPYNDTFSEDQHKFGPYQPIIDYRKKKNLPAKF